jgi:hypothetical protein
MHRITSLVAVTVAAFGTEGQKTVGQKHPDGDIMSCLIDFGRGQDPVT